MRKTGPPGLKPLVKSGFPHLGRQLLPPHTNGLALWCDSPNTAWELEPCRGIAAPNLLPRGKAELPSSGKAMGISVQCRADVPAGSWVREQPRGHHSPAWWVLLQPWPGQNRLLTSGLPSPSQSLAPALEGVKDFAFSKRSDQELILNLWITMKWRKTGSLEVKDVEWTIPYWIFFRAFLGCMEKTIKRFTCSI